jgi:phenylacetic acid degradation operon negative regulatory protein
MADPVRPRTGFESDMSGTARDARRVFRADRPLRLVERPGSPAPLGWEVSEPIDDLEVAPHLKPRALILDLFGDYLRYTGSEVKAGDLVRLLGVFGVESATVRVTLSRLRREQWFTTRRVGRETVYSLTDRITEILDEGRARIFADYNEQWDHTWTTVVYQSGLERLTRDQLRKRLSWLGFGPLSASTWISPRDRVAAARTLGSEVSDIDTTIMRSATGDLTEDRALAERCWDLGRINQLYSEFLQAHTRLLDTVDDLDGAQALIARTSLIASYRHFPFLDPWLPAELQPDDWVGARANVLFRAAHAALAPRACDFVASIVGAPTIDAPPE